MKQELANNQIFDREKVKLYPLTQPQQRIWYTELLYPNRNASTIILNIKMNGAVNTDILKQAIGIVVQRSDSFRIRIASDNGVPWQYIVPYAEEDLVIGHLEMPQEQAAEWLKKNNVVPFKLLHAPLYQFTIIRIHEEEIWLSLRMHHIATDGVSMIETLDQVTGFYQELANGTFDAASSLKANSYLDFIQAEQEYEQSDRYQKDKAYWFDKFSEFPETIGLKTYNPLTLSTAGRREGAELSEELHKGIKAFCEEHRISLFTFFLSALYIYVHKVTQEQDIPIGTLYANRTNKKEKDTIGMFVSTVATRVRVEPETGLLAFLQSVAKEQSSILRHQRYPYNKVIQDLRETRRSQDIQRLFGGSIQYRTYSFAKFGEFTMQPDNDFCGDIVNDFDIHMVDELDRGKMMLYFDYRTELFDEQEVAQIIRQFLAVAEGMIKSPTQTIQQLSLLSETEKETILNVFNDTAADYPSGQSIAALFEEQAGRTPEQTAMVCEGKALTYGDLNERANRLARTIRALGVTADDTVGMIAERSTQMVVGILGILKAGGAYVPVDPDYPEERVRYLLEDSGVNVLLTERKELVTEHFKGTTLDISRKEVYDEDGSNLEPVSGPNHLAYVIYTSGTTGKPKGVMVEQRNVVRLVKNTDYAALDETTRILQTGSVVFDASTFEIWGALLNGGQLHLVNKDMILHAASLKQTIQEKGITTMFLTTALFNQLTQQDSRLFASLDTLLVGGEAQSVPHMNRVLQDNPGFRLVNIYGPTENTTFSTAYVIPAERSNTVPIGGPIRNSTAYVVDSAMRLQPVGAWGELLVGGDGVARGYLNQPEQTAEKFIDGPFRKGERCYRTGDLVRWRADGTLEYKGRIDQQVKIRGYRIELGEIEEHLLQVEAVQEAVIIAREDENGQKQLCAYYVAERELGANEVRSALSQELPGYMVPSYFVQVEQMPLTPNGKVDRRALPAPEGSLQTGAEYVAPRTAVEQALVSVWQSILGVKNVGVLDNFFELGGDSIKAIQVSSRLLQAGYKLEMRELFQYPTVAELSRYVQEASRIADQGEVCGLVTHTPIQLWYLEQNPAEPHHFNQAFLLYRKAGFEEAALRSAVEAIVKHHDALRIVLRKTENGVYETWNRGTDGEGSGLYGLEIFDFTQVEHVAEAIETQANAIQSSIPLHDGPLVKLGLFRCADGDHLLMAIHHWVVDGLSWRILLEDLTAGYEQALSGSVTIKLPQKTDSFQTWADKLLAHADSPAMERERQYWLESGAAGFLPLPKDFADVGTPTVGRSEVVSVRWTNEETERLLKQANRAYHTEINDLLLTALGIAVQDWTGHDRIAVNLEGHGREPILPDVDVTRTVGWFTSQFPVVLEMGSSEMEKNISHRIRTVKEGLRRIPHRGIGFGLLKYLSSMNIGERVFAQEPELSFNYLGQFDQDLEQSGLSLSPHPTGEMVSVQTVMRYPVDVNSMIVGGELEMTIRYDTEAFRADTIKRLAGLLQTSLREVLDHCTSKEQPELTPSDLQMKGLSLAQLEQITELMRHVGELEDVFALTPLQKGMLFHSLMDRQAGSYFEQLTLDLEGSFRVEAFRRGFELLVQRHQVLRANYLTALADEPIQVVIRHKPVDFSYEDLRPLEADERLAYAESFLRQDKKRGFDLEQGALMRVSVLQTGDQSYRLVWSFHHILMDGWCLSIMLGEVFESYHAYLSSKQPKLASVTPYSRYFDWLEKQEDQEAKQFWSQVLSGYEQMTLLPQSDAGDAASGFAPVKHIFLLNRELTERLNRVAKQHQVTLYTLIQTAWGVILQNYNNSPDVVFGSVVSGRPAEIPGVESIVGLFINTIPVRLQAVPGESFAQAMIRSQEQTLKTQSYDTYPLFEIQKLTEQKQDLINHIIVFENYPMEEQAEQLLMKGGGESGFAISNVVMSEQTTYDFNMIVMPGDELRFQFEYNANAFDLAEIEQMQHHFVHVLEQIAANPAIPVDKLELVTGQEKELLLHGFNDTAAEYPRERTIHELFEEQAARTPERTAVLFEDERLTYRELNERANRLARTLRAEGVGADVPVAIMVERSLEMLVGIYAILKAGGAYVPIDPEYPAERIRYIVEDSGARLLLAQSRFLDRVPTELEGRVLDLNEVTVYAEDATNLPLGAGPRDMAYVIYTSGSTGKPKGAAIEHHSALNRILWMHERYPIGEADVILQKTTFTFDVSVWELFWWAMVGSSVCLLTPGGEKNPELILQAISRYGVTTMHFVPAMLHAFLDYAEQQPKPTVTEQTSSLRHVFASGEALPPQHVARFQEAIGRVNRTQLINLYGPTEATVDVSYFDCEPDESYAVIPIGKPVHNTRLYILKEGTEQLQPVGVAGELCIAGVQVARGYLNRPELTAEKFTADPFVAGERMYRTGDLTRWLPDGNIEYLGRIDHQVKIRGYRIELGELETELLRIESVLESVVVARDDGQGQKLLCAYYVATKELMAGELREALSKELPSYMVPTYFIQVERMPLSANGKIDRKSLPAPEASVQSGEAYAAPRTPEERALANILQTVLGLRTVGIHDNFFDLGGDSIKSIQVASRMMQAGYKLEMKDIFKYPTIASLSAHVRTAVRLADQGEVTGEAPLTPVQRWFFEHNPSQPQHFNQSFMIYRPDRFEEGALRQTFHKLAEHHDALRLVVQDSGSGYQVRYRAVTEGELLDLAVIDLQDRVMDDSLNHWIEEKATEIQGSIDLNAGPFVKLGLFRCADGDHLLIAVHHLAIDVVSWRILFEDFMTGYEQASKGEAIRLPLKTDSFQAWAQGLEQYTDSPALDSERAYWQQIEQASCRPLPKDYAYERPQLQDSELITLNWTPEETVQLLKQAHRAYNTEMNDLLLTALGIAIQRWSGLEDVLVSLEGHGREPIIPDLDMTRTVGWFTSVYPVLLSQGADMTLRERIKRTKEQLHAIPDKGIGYGLLRYLSRKQEAPALRAEPEISFNYLGQLDQDFQQHDIRLSPFAGGMTASADTALRFALDLNSLVVDGALQLAIRYSAKQYRRETVEQLAGHLHASLQEVIAHCVSKDRTELTPSDVSLKGVTIEELERLMLQTAAIGEIENVYNLTPMQKGILFHGLLEAGSGAYFEQTSFDLKGEFEPGAFAQSLDLLVQRHEALRTNFFTAWKENPVQVVFRSKRGTRVFEDLSGFSAEEREAEIARFKREDREKGFDLARDPLLRIAILRTGPQEHHMIWSFHHIIMDGWCLSIVAQEVFEAYFALVGGKQPELSEVWAYSSYIEWLERQNTQEASAYWSSYLSGYEEQTLLPAGKPGNSEDVSGYRAQRYDYELGSELTKRIHQTAKAHQVTINTLIQAAWGIVLQRYNGTDDAVFGSVVSGRPAEIPGVERMIGLFINTIPVRIRCAGEESFADVMKRAQEQAIASNAYETFPLYEIQTLTEQKQDLIRHIVIFENYPVDEKMEQLGGEHSALRLSGVQSMEQTNYDFNLVVLPGESMKLYMGYNAAAFEPKAIERIQAHLTYLLEQVVANPDIRIRELELVSGAEKEQILHAFNDTAVNSPREKTIYQLLEEQTVRRPEQVAVYCEGQRLTYRELNERANRLARTLRSAGVQ
ncbi:non-ribosomal peptide synthase domain TIGR01720/amino acid adenylation domain-containing protein, partial [Paenibacillus tianmuensis]